ncbi:MAG: tetratricopeptide repeat protein, partial [Lentisphaerae bacterium]|nr:tetratricopeptide repeat protein [Lentisphaerota bacterium]
MKILRICTAIYLAVALGAVPLFVEYSVPSAQAQTTDLEGDLAQTTMLSALLSAGRNALKQNDLSGAAFYYTRYLQEKPDDIIVSLEYAGILTQSGKYEESLAICEQILTIDHGNPEAQKLKAVALGRLGRAQDALRVIDELRAKFPDNLELQKIEAGFRAMEGDIEYSRELYNELIKAGLNSVQDLEDYLQLLAADRQWDLILETCEKHLVRFEPNDNIRFIMIQAMLSRHDVVGADSVYSELKEENMRSDAALFIADQLASIGKLQEALRFLEKVEAESGVNPDLVSKMALLDAYSKRPDLALKRVEAVPSEHRNDRLRITKAKIFWAAGRPMDALAELDRLALPDSHLESTLARLGLLYDLEREWEILPIMSRLHNDLFRAHSEDRKLAWCLETLTNIRFGDWETARYIIKTFKQNEPGDLAPDILAVMVEQAARRTVACDNMIAKLGARLAGYRPGIELVRPALLENVPSAAWLTAWGTRPTNPHLALKLAESLMRECKIAEAAEYYDMASAIAETKIAGYLGMAECALRMKDDKTMRRALQALNDARMDTEELCAIARIMLRADEKGKADAFLDRVPKTEVTHPEVQAIRVAWLIRMGRSDDAKRMIASIEPDNPATLGLFTLQLSQIASLAKDSNDKIYKIVRERLMVIAKIGGLDGTLAAVDVLMTKDEFDEVRKILGRSNGAYPDDMRVLQRLMTTNIRLRDYDKAEAIARKMLKRRPGDSLKHLILARTRVWVSDYNEAWSRYTKLIEDYSEDELLPLEFASKQNRARGRSRRAAKLADEYAEILTWDREIVAEPADVLALDDFSKAGALRYRVASWAFTDDTDLLQALDSAERKSHLGVYAEEFYL